MDNRRLMALLMAALLPLAACSGDGGDDDDDITGGDDDMVEDDDDTTPGGDDDTTGGDDDDDSSAADDDDPAGDDDDSSAADDDDDDDDDDTVATVAEIDHTIPAEGASVFCVDADIVVTFTAAVASATITLEDELGNAVAGTNALSAADTVLTFDPDDPLIESTGYTATIDWDGMVSSQLTFRTSGIGTLLTDPESAVEGMDYLLDLGNATVTQPSIMGSLLLAYFEDVELVIQITDVDDAAGTLRAFGGSLDDGEQDLCVPTMVLTHDPVGAWCNPFLEVGPAKLSFAVAGYLTEVIDARITAKVVQEGASIADGRLDGALDTRGLDPLVDPGGGVGATCTLVLSLGLNCGPCPDGAGPYCLPMSMEGIVAQPTPVTGVNPETGDVYSALTEVGETQVASWIAGGYCP